MTPEAVELTKLILQSIGMIGSFIGLVVALWVRHKLNPKTIENDKAKAETKQIKANERLIDHITNELLGLSYEMFQEVAIKYEKAKEEENGKEKTN